jgi:hypothetical protein
MTYNTTVGFVPPSGGRNTVSLLHGCFWTAILCAWSSMHPNLPSTNDTEWGKTLRRATWVLVGIVAPEYVAFVAIRQWYEVRWLQKEIIRIMELRRSDHKGTQVTGSSLIGAHLPSHGSESDEGATHGDASEGLDHEMTAIECLDKADQPQLMGSLDKSATVQDIDEDSPQEASCHGGTSLSSVGDDESTSSGPAPQPIRTYTFYVYMGGFQLLLPDSPPFRPDAVQFRDLLEEGLIDLPHVSTSTIKAFSKSDMFTKPWACMQMFWFIAVLIDRSTSRLPLTTLELYTAGQVSCTLACYFAWWEKPKDAEVVTEIPSIGKLKDIEVIRERDAHNEDRNNSRVGNNKTISRSRTNMQLFTFVGFLPTFLFGICHLLGWYQYFVTPAEKILWRTSSVCCLVLPLAAVTLGNITRQGRAQSLKPGISILVCLYVLFRVYIYVEVVIGLRQVPSAVYEDSDWTRYIPHVGS